MGRIVGLQGGCRQDTGVLRDEFLGRFEFRRVPSGHAVLRSTQRIHCSVEPPGGPVSWRAEYVQCFVPASGPSGDGPSGSTAVNTEHLGAELRLLATYELFKPFKSGRRHLHLCISAADLRKGVGIRKGEQLEL
jgi:hypothetical protein